MHPLVPGVAVPGAPPAGLVSVQNSPVTPHYDVLIISGKNYSLGDI
jgi:hypothetical protein